MHYPTTTTTRYYSPHSPTEYTTHTSVGNSERQSQSPPIVDSREYHHPSGVIYQAYSPPPRETKYYHRVPIEYDSVPQPHYRHFRSENDRRHDEDGKIERRHYHRYKREEDEEGEEKSRSHRLGKEVDNNNNVHARPTTTISSTVHGDNDSNSSTDGDPEHSKQHLLNKSTSNGCDKDEVERMDHHSPLVKSIPINNSVKTGEKRKKGVDDLLGEKLRKQKQQVTQKIDSETFTPSDEENSEHCHTKTVHTNNYNKINEEKRSRRVYYEYDSHYGSPPPYRPNDANHHGYRDNQSASYMVPVPIVFHHSPPHSKHHSGKPPNSEVCNKKCCVSTTPNTVRPHSYYRPHHAPSAHHHFMTPADDTHHDVVSGGKRRSSNRSGDESDLHRDIAMSKQDEYKKETKGDKKIFVYYEKDKNKVGGQNRHLPSPRPPQSAVFANSDDSDDTDQNHDNTGKKTLKKMEGENLH